MALVKRLFKGAQQEMDEPSLVGRGLRALYDTRRGLDPNTHIYQTIPRYILNKSMEEGPELVGGLVRGAGSAIESLPGAPDSLAEFGSALRKAGGPEPEVPPSPSEPSQADFTRGIQAAAAANAAKYGAPGEAARGTPEAAPASGRQHPAYVGPDRAAEILAPGEWQPGPDWGVPRTRAQANIDDRAHSEIAQRRAARNVEIDALAGPSPMEKSVRAEELEAMHDALADRGNLYAGFDERGNLTSPGSFYTDPKTGTIRNIPGISDRPSSLGEEGQKQARVDQVMTQIDAAQRQFEQERTELEERRQEIAQNGGYDADGVVSAQLDRALQDLERREQFARQFFDRMLAGLGVDVDAFYRQDEVDPVDAVIAGWLARDNPAQ